MHNEMLQVEGKKMSKSLGNFFTVRDLLDQGVAGDVIRFVMLSTHYRKPMDWTEKKREEAEKTLARWYALTDGIDQSEDLPDYALDRLRNDLNTPGFVADMHGFEKRSEARQLFSAMQLLGFPQGKDVEWFRKSTSATAWGTEGGHHQLLREPLRQWMELRNDKQYEAADDLKRRLEATGLKLSVAGLVPKAEVLENFDPTKLEDLK